MKLSGSFSLLLAQLASSSPPLAFAAPALRGQEATVDTRHRALPPKWSSGGGGCKIAGEKVGVYVGGGTFSNGGIGISTEKWARSLVHFWLTGMQGPPGSGFETTTLNAGGGASFGGDESVTYVILTLSEIEDCYNGELNALSLLIMPGGSAYEIQDALGANGKAAITSFLDNGGSYLGFCAGGYYMAKGYYWKGYDGAPVDNCKDQFCRYDVSGTFSYDQTTKDFTVHEWGGTSYHSNLVAYGPLANVLVEGPIEEIAGPWSEAYDPNAPYDSHVVIAADPGAPPLRWIYYGGSTEGYIYTNATARTSGDWGTPLAHFDQGNNNDLSFPSDLWTLKETDTGHGGKIVISSAHVEASIFYTGIQAGMSECQMYNNYAFVTRSVAGVLGITLPSYDTSCNVDADPTEIKDTSSLFPSGLAYQNAPRIESTTTGGGGGGGGGCTAGQTSLELIEFDDGTLGGGTITGGAANPWQPASQGACDGSTMGLTAGVDGGVDSESYFTVAAPEGATSLTYFYSYPSALDSGDDFHVYVNDVLQQTYETGSGVSCAQETIAVSPGDVVTFKCHSGGNNEICSIDQVQFCG